MASPSTTSTELGPPPPALTAAVVLVTVEVVVQLVALWSGRRSLSTVENEYFTFDMSDIRATVAGALVLSAAIAMKIVLAVRTRNRKPGSALLLLAAEAVGILAVLATPSWPLGLRLGFVAYVIVIFALVGSALGSFPSPDLPPHFQPGEPE